MNKKIGFLAFVFMFVLFAVFNAYVGCDSPELEIVDLYPCDLLGNMRSEFEIGSKIHFNLTLRNPTSESKNVVIVLVLFDTLLDPICEESFGATVPSNGYECYIINSTIPRWAHVGPSAKAYVNILEAFTTFPIVPEHSTALDIVVPSQKPRDVSDILTVVEAFDSEPGDPNWNPIADINQDGVVNIIDVVMVGLHFDETYP